MPSERFDYRIERQRHESFVGRADLLERLDQLLADELPADAPVDAADRWVLVTGGPGMGKSALLAWWLARRERAGARVPHHFIRRGEYDWDDPAKLVGSLIAQLDEQFPAQREPEADARMHPAARLATALARVSAGALVPERRRLVVMIDGLDEYDPPPGAQPADPLAAFLPHALPPGVSFLCACRPRHPYVSGIEARSGALVQIDLDAPELAASNEATVRSYWDAVARSLGLPRYFVDEAVERAGGNLQHATMVRKFLSTLGTPMKRRVQSIPSGLEALYEKLWARVAVLPLAVHGLGVLCAAREALTLDELGAAAGWSDEAQRRAFMAGARELLVETWRPDCRREYRLHHESIREFIARAIGAAAIRAHHAALAERFAVWPAPEPSVRRYALRHGLSHRVEAGEWADAWRLAADMRFLEAKCRELGEPDTEADVSRAAERCRAAGAGGAVDETLCRRFEDLARALRRESHWLREAPEATAALVWNRLRRLGWSAAELDAELRLPAEASFLRVRHAVTRESPALVRDLTGHQSSVLACAATPDSRAAVSASGDRTLRVWDLESGRVRATLEGHRAPVEACAVTPDGQHVVSTSRDGMLAVWDLERGTARFTKVLSGGERSAWALTPDGQRAVLLSSRLMLVGLDGEVRELAAIPHGLGLTVRACAVTPDGHRVIAGSDDGALRVWDLGSGRLLSTLPGRTGGVMACAVTPDGARVVSGALDGTLSVWELESGRLLASCAAHTRPVSACVVTPTGCIVSASYDETLKLWSLDGLRPLATFEGHAHRVTACAVTPDGKQLISASDDQTLKVWDLDVRRSRPFSGHAQGVSSCAATPDGGRAITASPDGALKIWDTRTGQVCTTADSASTVAAECAVTAADGQAVSVSEESGWRIWDLESGRARPVLESAPRSWHAFAVTPDARRAVVASMDKRTLEVWDVRGDRRLATLEGLGTPMTTCAITPDGQRVIAKAPGGALRVWDAAGGAQLLTLEGDHAPVGECLVALDGRRIVSVSADRTLGVWDLEGGRRLARLEGHADWIRACAATSDGRCLVSVSEDRTLKVWDLETETCLFTHRGDVPYYAVAVAGDTIIAGDATGGLWFLDGPRGAAARSAAGIEASGEARTGAAPPRRLLHLSDLHFAKAEQATAAYAQLAADLREQGVSQLDALVVSGDLVDRADPAEYDAARRFLEPLMADFGLAPRQVALVPGNHDASWAVSEQAYRLHRRKQYMGPLEPGCFIERDDGYIVEVRDEAAYRERLAAFAALYRAIKGTDYPLAFEEQATLDELPDLGLCILGLSSAWQCDHHFKDRAGIHPGALARALQRLGPRPAGQLRLVAFHHPIHGGEDARIRDTGFLQQLAVHGFELALHGHVHKADAELYRYDRSAGGRRIEIVAAGTFGAHTREWVPGYPLQYNLLLVEPSRITVETRCRREVHGAWEPDARWRQGPGKDPLPRYFIER